MPACPSCGRENAEDARFCSACGAPLATTPAREQRKVVTVLFCDLVGSTALGESNDPEAVRARMRVYFDDLRAVIERHGGTVEKFVGDAVMAVFGIPQAHEDDALRAVRAAFEMQPAVGEHGLEARIGVNTGEVVVGGEGETLVTGDAVNVAARLEQAAAAGEVLLGAETRALVRDAVRVDPVEPLELKGKSEPVAAFRLRDVRGDAAPIARNLATPLVGRERERERLRRAFEDAAADRTCQLFTLLGPAGIGKSRLVADFLDRVGADADVHRGRCLSYGEGITYWPLVEMLVPLGIEPESIVASTPAETRVAFRKLLEERAADRPQVVVVDDLQWAEPVFVDLVEHVADLSRAPIFLLCIARNEFLDARPDWGGGKLNATAVLLEPLGESDRAELLRRHALGTDLDAELAERIAAASAGNPLYLEEMLAMVRERGDREVTVPSTIQVLLQARLDALDADARTVLERGAIEGEVFHRGAVSELLEDERRADLDGHLASLVRRDLIRSEASLVSGEEAYRFRHLLIRDAAYAAMPKDVRATLHAGFADWLERSTAAAAFERDEILGYHLEQAFCLRAELGGPSADGSELAARAGARLIAAGHGALDRTDLHAAASLLRRGIDLAPIHDQKRLEALPDLAYALTRVGELDEAEEVLRSAIAVAQEAGEPGVAARSHLALNSLRARVDPAVSMEDELRTALEIAAAAERAGDLSTLAHARMEIGLSQFFLGRGGDGDRDLQRAADLAREAGDARLEQAALGARLRPIAWGPITADEGIAFCSQLIERETTNVADRAHALQVRGLLQAMQGDITAARSSAARAWELIEEFGLRLLRGIYGADTGFAEAIAGDLEQAERELRRGRDLLIEVGDTSVRATLDSLLADVLVRQGHDDEALELAEEARTIAATDDLDAQPRWRAAKARVVSRRGSHAEAERLVREALALLESSDFVDLVGYVHDVLGEVLARSGRTLEAVESVSQAAALHEQKGNVVSAARSRAVWDELRAARPS